MHITSFLTRVLTAARARPLFLAAFFLAVLIPLIIFGQLAGEILEGTGLPFDDPILRWFHSFATPARDRWIVAITNLGGGTAMFIYTTIATILLLLWQKRRAAEFLVLGYAGAGLLNICAKLFFSRQRPHLWDTIVTEKSFSFPSGHAMGSMSFAAALALLTWHTPWRWPVTLAAFSFAITIGLSRVYLGVHFPSDVAAGWCAALVWVGGVYTIQRWLARRSRRATSAATH